MQGEQKRNGADAFEALRGHKYCQLVTFRRDGTRAETPVWFALDGERLYVKTEDPSGKIKRIRREPRVQVAPCTVLGKHVGPPTDAVARILHSAAEEQRAEVALRRRYALGRRLFALIVEPWLHRRGQRPVYLVVVAASR